MMVPAGSTWMSLISAASGHPGGICRISMCIRGGNAKKGAGQDSYAVLVLRR